MNTPDKPEQSGLPHAVGAYLAWGLLPLYLMLVHRVPAFEFVGWRIIFTLPACLLIVVMRRQFGALLAIFANPRLLLMLFASAALIGTNWLIYIAAIQAGHVYASSIGYYVNPLVNVLAGAVFLKERLSFRQWLAVAIAAAGVLPLAWAAREMLGISLSLAATFAGYGLVRKLTPVPSLLGLTVEIVLMLLPAIALVSWFALSPAGVTFGKELTLSLLIAASGGITAVPLVLFATAAQRMDFSTLGFVQYLAPTIVFFEALFVFHEPLRPVQLASFIAIWSAIALFVYDSLSRRHLQPAAT